LEVSRERGGYSKCHKPSGEIEIISGKIHLFEDQKRTPSLLVLLFGARKP